VLIWINGTYGAGKTSVARRLAELRPGARLIDPEQIGFMLRRIWPGKAPADFQDLPIWRELTLATLRAAAREPGASTMLVPMTLANEGYFTEIVGGLRAAGIDVRHFTLIAKPPTLRRRLRRRIDWPSSRRWALARVDECGKALEADIFGVHVATDDLRIDAVARRILDQVGEVNAR
jgi:hypothetical protein